MAAALSLGPLLRPSKTKDRKYGARVTGWSAGLDPFFSIVLGVKAGAAPTTFADLTNPKTIPFQGASRGSYVNAAAGYAAALSITDFAWNAQTVGDHIWVAVCDESAPTGTTPLQAVVGPLSLGA